MVDVTNDDGDDGRLSRSVRVVSAGRGCGGNFAGGDMNWLQRS